MNLANSRESSTSSTSASDAGDAVASSGRVAFATGVMGVSMAPPRMASVSFAASRIEGTAVRASNNSISFETSSARKRSVDALSPFPSPLLSFLSPALTASSSASTAAFASATSMNQFDLSSARLGTTTGHGLLTNDRGLQATAVGNNSLKFVVPSGIKRVRRESPLSPRSVGEVAPTVPTSAPTGVARPSPALPPTPPSASSDKIRSVVRGLEHVSRCSPAGCGNPLCVSTRGFMNKVSGHLVAMAGKPGHIAAKCGACQLWNSIVRSHASICMEVNCSIPLCSTAHETSGASEASTGCRPRDRRDDNDDHRHSLFAR